MVRITLNDEQFAFLNEYHEIVEYGMVYAMFFHDYTLIDQLEKTVPFKKVFGDMLWDDIYDRYEDHEKYNPELKRRLHRKFTELQLLAPPR